MTTTDRVTTTSVCGDSQFEYPENRPSLADSSSELGLPHRRAPSDICQDPRSPIAQGGIFLLNFDPLHRERIALVLKACRYKVFIPEMVGRAPSKLKDNELMRADFILFDLSRLNHDDVWLTLRRICRLRKQDGMPIMVHCFSRIYRGPEFHKLVEDLGVRMDYYAE